MSNINPNPFTTRPEIEGTFGVVTSTHWIATAVGMATLEKGGNAFDAAIATAFTLQVVEPHLNGPGGDVPVLVFDVRRGRPEVICGQGVAPAAATIAHYRDLGLDMVPGTGLLAACVPGTFETWMLLLRDYGTLRLADVLTPAIEYAHNGHPLLADVGRGLSPGRGCARPRRHVREHNACADLRADPGGGGGRRS
jgi:gamma-glutamyltranspeptidase / glutathione hydrolase